MNKIFIFILIAILYSINHSKYESSYYKNVSNILEKYPRIDIDYIFSNPEKENLQNEGSNKKDNLISNPFQSIFYDYYETSVPLYDENMKCYFPIKKRISLDINNEFDNITKVKNISKYYGNKFIRLLKGKCEKFYIERWYYTLCPLVGAMQTLSYIKPNDKKKEEEDKQEVNYLGYAVNDQYNNSDFLNNLNGKFKEFAEKKYVNEINDIKEDNLFNNYGKKNKIIGIYKNLVKFYGENAFDSNKYINYNKYFILEYSNKKKNDKITFKTNIIKIINSNLILLNETIDKNELFKISKIKIIKIVKSLNSDIPNNVNSFFNQSFFVYKEYLYTSNINLVICINMNCHVTISNDINLYKLDLIVDSKFAILDKKRDIYSYEDEKYCLFLGDEKLYFFGKGEIEELSETDDHSTFILSGENLNIENTEEILLLFNDTFDENNNYVFINDIFNNKFISLKYQQRINQTHFKVKMSNKKDILYFEKQITLDGKYIIVKNNTKKEKEEEKKEEAKYVILGNDKNISLEDNYQEKKEIIKIDNSKEEYQEYKIPNSKEFIFNFELSPYNYNIKDSYITICFSSDKKCKPGEDYEMIIDIKNDGLLIQKMNEINNNNNGLIFSKVNFNINEKKIKLGIIYMNSTIYFNSIFKEEEEKGLEESEIRLKYLIKNNTYSINYIIINKNKSKNIYIENINLEDYVSFNIFKNIYFYEQKFLLDDNAIFIDTFENGDYCTPIKAPRRVIIYYTCDEEGIYDLKITNVFEDKKDICVYHYYAKSKYLCNPNKFMQNYLKFSGLKSLCFLDN